MTPYIHVKIPRTTRINQRNFENRRTAAQRAQVRSPKLLPSFLKRINSGICGTPVGRFYSLLIVFKQLLVLRLPPAAAAGVLRDNPQPPEPEKHPLSPQGEG